MRRKKYGGWILYTAVMLLICIFSVSITSASADSNYYAEVQQKALNCLQKYHGQQEASEIMGWSAIALCGNGLDVMSSEWRGKEALAGLKRNIAKGDQADLNITTDAARLILVLKVAGQDPSAFAGLNLPNTIKNAQLKSGKFPDDLRYGGESLVNAHIWSIIALQVAGNAGWNREAALAWLKSAQNPDGGYNYLKGAKESDIDVTCAALIAFSLCGAKKTDVYIKKSLDFLREHQCASGGFASWGTENCESTAMVIQALISLGIDPGGSEWKKKGGGPADALLKYQRPDGAFSHINGGKSNIMATQQALLALGDFMDKENVYQRLMKKKPVR